MNFSILSVNEAVTEVVQEPGLIEQGGVTLLVLMLLSVLTVAIVIFLLMSVRAEELCPSGFVREAERLAASGDLPAVQSLCDGKRTAAAKIISSVVSLITSSSRPSYEMIRDAAESEGARQAGRIRQKLNLLMDIAKSAPMIGLLGTVIGMRQSFAGLKVGTGSTAMPVELADGIGKALITTAGGLILSIVALFFYSMLRQRINAVIGELETRCSSVVRLCAANIHLEKD